MVAIRAHYDGKVIVPDEAVDLPAGRALIVHVQTVEPESNGSDGLAAMADLAVDTGVRDLARNVDHYLYGHPKVEDNGR